LRPRVGIKIHKLREVVEIIYKGLKFRRDSTLNYLELIMEDKDFSDFSSYIYSTSLLVEYALHTMPDYIILNKLDANFTPFKELYGFTRQYIITPLKNENIKKVLVLTNEKPYNDKFVAEDDEEPYLLGFECLEDAKNWIKANNSF